MGDDMFDFDFREDDDYLEVQFVNRGDTDPSPLDARRTLEAAIRKIPDSALRSLKSFQITVSSKKKEG